MKLSRFKDILYALHYTENDPPDYVDRFHEVREVNQSWNQNMMDIFLASWISFLDESMMVWFNKYAPVFIVVHYKPHPLGNEWHIIACVLCGVIYRAEMMQ